MENDVQKNTSVPQRGDLGFENNSQIPNPTRGFGVFNQFGDVRSLQKLLRNISGYYDYIPTVIPDGIFGDDTLRSVKSFQTNFGLEPTGEIDLLTWNKIVSVSRRVDDLISTAENVFIYPESGQKIYPGQKSVHLFVIQAMMKALSDIFDDFTDIEITGIHDDNSVRATRNIQNISGIPDNGIIDVEFFNFLSELYETYISRDHITPFKNYQGIPV